ncbi:MAG TPA: hypothetical protein VIQ99_06020, partial [Gammaproteobacteria bacterium]
QRYLGTKAAGLTIVTAERAGSRLVFDVAVASTTGHKLPTAYPSRRAWLHVVVTDAAGAVLFESGALRTDGGIAGNDNDIDGTRFEPHYTELTSGDQVQIYESIMTDQGGAVTTGLLRGVRYVKDNRLLPRGFDKTTAPEEVAVRGGAAADVDFVAGGDRVRYRVDVGGAAGGPVHVVAELLYQSIGYRWAENLRGYDSDETRRFVRYYGENAAATGSLLARVSTEIPAR